MAEFEVKINSMKTAVSKEKSIANKLIAASNHIDECEKVLSTSVSGQYAAVKRNLNSLSSQVHTSADKVNKMASALSEIYGMYNYTEAAVYGQQLNHEKVADAKDYKSDALGLLNAIIGGFGTFGKTASLIVKILSGEMSGDKLAIGVLKVIEKLSGAVINKVDPNGPGWVQALLGEKVDSTKASAATKAASKVVKWAGHALTLAENAFSNFKEFKDYGGLGNARFWQETALETIVDIGTGVLVKGAVSAVVGAATAALALTPPGWVVSVGVAVGTGVVMFAGDQISKAFSGKKLTENISDFVLDTGEKLANGFSAVGNAVSSAWNRITRPWTPRYALGGGGAW